MGQQVAQPARGIGADEVAALKALSEEGAVPVAKVAEAIQKYGINADKVNPLYA